MRRSVESVHKGSLPTKCIFLRVHRLVPFRQATYDAWIESVVDKQFLVVLDGSRRHKCKTRYHGWDGWVRRPPDLV